MSHYSVDDSTPILIGVGQVSDHPDSPAYRQLSPADLAAEAAKNACEDALSLALLAGRIDAIYSIRTVADSTPSHLRARNFPFGSPDNMPAAIAARLGAEPRLGVYSPACGDAPQKLVGEICERLHAGEFRLALLCGGEAASTMRAAKSAEVGLDWCEHHQVTLDDRHWNAGSIRSKHMTEQNLISPTSVYPLLEQARRARLGMNRTEYAFEMGRLLAPFSAVAEGNPHAFGAKSRDAHAIADVNETNRMISDPHPLSAVARDSVNLGAAVLLSTVGVARELGIAEDKWVYLHGYSSLNERAVLEREDLGASPAMAQAYAQALAEADTTIEQIKFLDIYSCFPIAVFAAIDSLGLEADDPRRLTVTGGLPYLGGPGNNYSTHALVEMVQRLRAAPGSLGLVGANGGFMSTHAVGVYSTTPKEWKTCDSSFSQARIDALPGPAFTLSPKGWGKVESYTVLYDKQGAKEVIVIGRLDGTDERFVANSAPDDTEALQAFAEHDGLGLRICMRWQKGVNRFALSEASLNRLVPPLPKTFLPNYEHILVEQKGPLLEIIINRAEVNNALTPEANDELEHIFDVFEADNRLWVAIICGAGTRAFCTGNDLKASASGRRMWMPRSGFGGLTARKNREKPIICAVNGFAMGGGFEIALASDIIIADSQAQFALSEVRVGLLAGAGGLQRLTRQIPEKQAMEMILTGRRVGAEEAQRFGFVTQLVPEGTALEGARKLAEQILECSPNSIRLSKRLLNEQSRYASLDDSIRPYSSVDYVVNSEDFMEGATAFAQKRKPQWRNR